VIKERFEQLKKKLTPRKENILPFITSVAITLLSFLGIHYFGNHFTEAMWIVNLLLLGILLSVIMFIAGFAVLKSLAAVGAEISLLIFLAQSYCDVPNRLTPSNEALKSLVGLGLIFIVVAFGRSLYKLLKENYQTLEKERRSKEKIVAVALFLMFTGLLIWEVYLVISPIILNLCIYKP
jgi:hypothetical protein